MITNNFVKFCIKNGGQLCPLNVNLVPMPGTTLTNPSIFITNDNKILVNIRHTDYTLFHSETAKYKLHGETLRYDYAENNNHINTINYICELNDLFEISTIYKVNTTKFDKEPLWTFTGLEDVRLINWNDNFYLTGVRRDTTTNGQGRIELSEISFNKGSAVETKRIRLPAPGNNDSYCEKNWMPILDRPFHFVKWTNPTEIVKVNIDNNTTTTTILNTENIIPNIADLKGGSQLILWNNYYLAVVHESQHISNSIQYLHRFVLWDQNFNLISISDTFIFMDGSVEFCCGLALFDDDFFLTFGFQDNAAFLLKFPQTIINQLLR